MAVTDVRHGPKPQVPEPEPVERRWVDRFDPRLVNTLTAVGFGLPVALVLWLVAHYGVNVVEGDQWDDVKVIGNSYSNLFDWSSLWAQHNENRIFFPNLVVIALSRTTHFNIEVEEYLSVLMLIAATGLVILTHKRRSPNTPWLYYCPVAILMLSICQYGNMLWGFQMAWYLVLLAMAASFYLVDRISLTWLAFIGAVVAGVVGSFSSLQGLLIWPAGLVLLYHRRRAWHFVVPWVVVGVAAVVLYFHNFNSHEAAGPHNAPLHHLGGAAKFYAFALGDILGIPFHLYQAGNNWIIFFGLVIIVLAVLVVVFYGIHRQERGGSPLGVALICMGLLFAATVTEGRVIFGYWAASASRYTTFDLLVPVGIYLALLDRPDSSALVVRWMRPRSRGGGNHEIATPLSGAASLEQNGQGRTAEITVQRAEPSAVERIGLRAARIAMAAVLVVAIAFALPNGIRGSRSNYTYQAQGVKVLRNFEHQSDNSLVFFLYIFNKASFIRAQADTLQKHHLSVFSDEAPGS